MYGYEEYPEITPDHILQKISPEKIFEFVLGENFSFATRYKSPFRTHKNAGSCRFERREDGTILFVDFGDISGTTHRTCFKMVMDKYRVSLTGAIKIICDQFQLSLSSKDYEQLPDVITHRVESIGKRAEISFLSKDFNKYDVQHWSQFLIRPEHLIEDSVYSVKKYTTISDKGTRSFTPYKYCYAIDFIDAVKIYQPYQTEYKWITNCNENHIGNIDNLPPSGDELIIQKSYKDHRVLRNTISSLSVIWFQNEGCVPSEEILVNLIQRFKLITIFFDNDATGIVAAIKLADIFNNLKPGCARMVIIPEDIEHKDPAAFINKEGRKDLIQVLDYIGIKIN